MNTFGHLFRITTWGESHGGAVGVVVDGCPPRIPITPDEIQFELDRRRPGQSKLVTQRKESDTVHILSGVFEGQTLGTPILMLVWNEDARPEAYESFKQPVPPLARRLHLPGEVRDSQLAGRRAQQCARDRRARRGRRTRQKGAAHPLGGGSAGMGGANPHHRGTGRPRRRDLRGGGEQPRALSRPRRRREDDAPYRAGAQAGRLGGRGYSVHRAECAAQAGAAPCSTNWRQTSRRR
jgi:hypothetical protein